MLQFKASLKDIHYVLNDLLDYPNHCKKLQSVASLDEETSTAITEEAAKFAEQILAPLWRVGDEEGCRWHENGVSTPAGFKQAYEQYVDAGWPLLSIPEENGGQGLPISMGLVVEELIATANAAWSGYPGLSHGAIRTLLAHGNDWQKQVFLPHLVSGHWTGTMCLTEAQCGSDLGLIRTTAKACGDESYTINGSKIFISCGEHDITDNIVHIVLARLTDSPKGSKGLSLFVVPKYLPDNDGGEPTVGERNGVSCGSIEHKMGIHGMSTCVMNFDEAKGYLIGKSNQGLACMFTFMNFARLTVGMQGVVHSELAYQGAVNYARERLAMRSMSGAKNPEGPADPIIVHPDIRRMLLAIKVFAEGGRAFCYYIAQLVDRVDHGQNKEDKQSAENLLSFLTPICKGFLTEVGFEAANLGLQVYGGHGYIRENGMEQNVRDSRISTLYEGTTGIQALDLLGRKVLGSQGELLKIFTAIVREFGEQHSDDAELQPFIETLLAQIKEWEELSTRIGMLAMKDPEEMGAAATDYLMYSGYCVLAYFWARMAVTSLQCLESGDSVDTEFHHAKVQTATFYFQRLLPRTRSLKVTIESGASSLMTITEAGFIR